ncbi:MAG TPA: glycine betaine ABC transporter substrate-binding protein [Devosia sp.]|jgi:glycine betaine/proline transport system substrate-binding protein|nr:glycine betaine ABC transporter substrate-binding protein [Devosia sp.]
MSRIFWCLALVLLLAAPAVAQDIVSLPPPDSTEPSSSEPPGPPPPCGGQTITIAKMQWPSAELLAEIHARLIKQAFGCDVEVVPGDLASTASSMGVNGQPAVAPELWISRVADIWNNSLQGQEVREAGTTYAEPVFEGWFVPDYVVAAHPDLTNVAALKTYWKEFAGTGKKAKFISCPPDWACSVINRNLIRANGLEDLFDIVEPANRFELDTLIAAAVSRKEPILFYYWQPNAVLAQFNFKPIDLGPFNKDNFVCLGRTACADPKPSGFDPEPVVVALAQWVYLDAPEVAAYFARAHMPFAEMNALLQNLNEPGATVEAVADAFVAARGAVWQQWVGKPVPAAQ